MYPELKENRPHGTMDYPYSQYYMRKPKKAFHIPVHWHDEVEIIYLKKGQLRISIEEESFDAVPGDVFFVNSGELHFMETDDMAVEYYTLLFPLEFVSFQSKDILEREILQPLRGRKLLFVKTLRNSHCLEKVELLLKEMISVNPWKKTLFPIWKRSVLNWNLFL